MVYFRDARWPHTRSGSSLIRGLVFDLDRSTLDIDMYQVLSSAIFVG